MIKLRDTRKMIRYTITRHVRLDGVRLSKLGHWGNLPFLDDETAAEAARKDAGAEAFTVERITFRPTS